MGFGYPKNIREFREELGWALGYRWNVPTMERDLNRYLWTKLRELLQKGWG